jgi:hypothetical protein
MQDELKACPFCGGEAAVTWHDGFPSVRCNDCGCSTGMMASGYVTEAIAAWKTRADPALAAAQAEVARLRLCCDRWLTIARRYGLERQEADTVRHTRAALVQP